LDLGCIADPPCNSSFGRRKNENFEFWKKFFSFLEKVEVYIFLSIVFDADSEYI